ncbi:MAG: hypothetical protein WA432_02315 [Candidatus Babeliaceae bacterium]
MNKYFSSLLVSLFLIGTLNGTKQNSDPDLMPLLGLVYKPDSEGKTALHHLACKKDTLDGVKTVNNFLSLGTKINTQDNKGNSALHYTAKNECHMMYSFLIQQGANENLLNHKKQTPKELMAKHNKIKFLQI